MHNTTQLPESPAAMIAYHQSLHEFITEQVSQLRANPFEKAAGAEGRIKTLAATNCLHKMGYVEVDEKRLAANFQHIVQLLTQNAPGNELASTLSRAIANGDFGPDYWQKDLQMIETELVAWAEDAKLDPDSLLQVAHWAISPFWRLAGERYASELKEIITNERPNCPICGKNADFAILTDKENGRRYLACQSCNLQWPYKRMGCTYCGNSDYNQLGYILLDDLQGYRIYHCEKCRTYLKTFDQRAAVARLDDNLMLENVRTLFLDLLAINKGYLPVHG